MTSVRETQRQAPHRPASGPRCTTCGAPITHTPGKRPRVYCGEACKKRAKRALAKIAREAADGAASQKGTLLGKETTEFRSPLRPAETRRGESEPVTRETRARTRKRDRYAGRRTLWQITTDTACRGCGRQVMDPESGVVLAQTAEGTAAVLGLMKCGRIWLCPVCSATIRHRRAEEVTRAVVSWVQQGGTAYLVTFTARHASSDQLATLMDAIQGTRADADAGIKRRPGAYQRLITGAAWAGDKRRAANQDGIRGRLGYVGMIRATEITVGQANGWHPHIHAIVFVGGQTEGERADKRVTGTFTPSESALAEWQGHFRSVWTRHLAAVDPDFKPSDKHGVDFKRLETVRDAEDLGQYIAKIQDGSKSTDPAKELARGDLKAGRHGNMAPFQLLGRIGDLMGGVSEDDAPGHGSLEWCLGRWLEYETATKGRRAIEWTRHLRPLLGLDGGDTEEDDADLLAAADATSEFRAGVRIGEDAWTTVTGRGLDLAVVESVEGREGIDHDAVSGVLRSAGVMAGAVRVLTPGEVADAWDSILATLAQRRELAAERRRAEAQATP